MNSEQDIVTKLKEAISTSCNDAFHFSDDETHLIDAEYLLTVNAAKAIKELNHNFGMPYKIFLEHDTIKFATNCTPLIRKIPSDNPLKPEFTFQTKNNTRRAGKIDIAIYAEGTEYIPLYIPLCAIEVKGFNPSKMHVVQDLERNAEYFHVSSPTGPSKLPFAVFIALHSYKNTWADIKEKKNIEKIKERYMRYISSNELLNSLSHNVEVFTIRRGSIPDFDDPHIQEHGLQGDEDYHFIGAIITTTRKEEVR